ncbi:MAG: M4 family metallopeptidase [Mariniphaga sp.]|nr:M4 family metallopeptidase [Mariniphaga sp.]
MKAKIFVTFITALICINAYTQKNEIKEMKIGYSGAPSYLVFNTDKEQYTKGQEKNIWKEYLGISSSDKLEMIKSRTGKNGMEHQKFQQYYKGVKVEGGVYTLHIKKGNIESANGTYLKIDGLDINPVLFEEEAILAAIENTKATKYAWESEGMENIIKQDSKDEKATYYPEAELVIWHPYRENIPKLAYKIEIYSIEPLNREYIYVDATSRKILGRDPIMKAESRPGYGITRYSGGQNISIDIDEQDVYRLRDPSRCDVDSIHVWNLERHEDLGYRVDFENNSASWDSLNWPEWDTLKNNAALDAIWALQGIYDYFYDEEWYSYDGNNAKIDCYVHWGIERRNAFWMGDHMVLGDGYETVDAFTSVDIIAHEFAHGICQETCDLQYQKASGAINESLSDIWGAVLENKIADGKQTWRCGEDLLNDSAFRAMDNPHLYGQPDTYGTNDTLWYDYSSCSPNANNDECGVHTNSGVMNYWFYLLSEGGSGTNANGNEYQVTGIGINDATEMVFEMEVNGYINYIYADFGDVRTASIQAADDLGYDIQKVLDAWYAVGVGKPQVTGTDLLCSSASFEVEDNLPSWASSIAWTQSSNLTRTSGPDANPCTFSYNGDGEGWIQVRIVSTFNDTLNSSIKKVWVGVPVIDTIDGASSTEVDETECYHASYDHDCDATGFFWGTNPNPQGLTISPQTGYDWTYITFPEADNYTVITQLENTCGWSSYVYKPVSVSGSKSAKIENTSIQELLLSQNSNMSIFPNPANNEATILINSDLLLENGIVNKWELEVYSPDQKMILQKANIKTAEVKINTQNWIEGIYLIRVKIGEAILNGKLIVAK